MIVNRDSNDISFMDIKTRKIVGRTFLGNNVNPSHGHDVAGREVCGEPVVLAPIKPTSSIRTRWSWSRSFPVDIAPEHLGFSPDSRWYYQGNPEGDSFSVIDMQSLTKIKTISGFR
jgi:hypothetical protein